MTNTNKTNEQIYLEWLNDYLTTKEMASHYNMSVKKLSDSHYVVVTDEPIKEGDWFYDTVLCILCQTDEHTNYEYANNSILVKKITHSNKPLEDVIGTTNDLNAKGWVNIKPLDLFECKSLIGEVDKL